MGNVQWRNRRSRNWNWTSVVAVLKGLLPAHQIWQSSSAERCITVTVTVTSPQSSPVSLRAAHSLTVHRGELSLRLASSRATSCFLTLGHSAMTPGRWTSATYLGRALLTQHPTPVYIHIKNKSLSSFLSFSFSLSSFSFFPWFFSFFSLLVQENVDFTDYFTSDIVVSLLGFQIRPGIGPDIASRYVRVENKFFSPFSSSFSFLLFSFLSYCFFPLFLFERTWISPIISLQQHRCF